MLPLLKAAAQPTCETSTPPPFLIKGWWQGGWGWTWTIEILVCFQLSLSGMNFTKKNLKADEANRLTYYWDNHISLVLNWWPNFFKLRILPFLCFPILDRQRWLWCLRSLVPKECFFNSLKIENLCPWAILCLQTCESVLFLHGKISTSWLST
jgi:hypothetical protein